MRERAVRIIVSVVAVVSLIMGVPGADDVMLNYQSTSHHDAWFVRQTLGLRPAPEFEGWLERFGIMREQKLQLPVASGQLLQLAGVS